MNIYVYVYVNQSPVNFIDPTGEFGLFGAAFGAGFDITFQLAMNSGRWEGIDWTNVFVSAAIGAVAPGVFTMANKVNKFSRVANRNPNSLIGSRAGQRVGEELLVQIGVQVAKQGAKEVVNEIQGEDSCEKKCK